MMMRGSYGGGSRGGGGARRLMRESLSAATSQRKADVGTVRRVAAAFKPYGRQILLVLAAIIFVGMLGVVNPYMLKFSISIGFAQQNFRLLTLFVAVMAITPIVNSLIGVGQPYLNTLIGQRVMRDLPNQLYSHPQRMPLKFVTYTRTDKTKSRLPHALDSVHTLLH